MEGAIIEGIQVKQVITKTHNAIFIAFALINISATSKHQKIS